MAYQRTRRTEVDSSGTFSCPECGCILSSVRSLPEHRGFFAYVKFAFDNWPENGFEDFWPDNAEHLRAWLEIRSNHKRPPRIYTFKTREQAVSAAAFAKAEMAADNLEGSYSWIVPLKGQNGFEVVRPASIKWDKLGEARFNKLVNEVSAIIKEIIGVSFTEWKEGAHRMEKAA